ncbi:MAG TPA: hypothetical protein VGV59_12200 [Pyrinomonadaceae bacterium]|nr:hypothetical protein [Pyrinomonadaceae bacterium]
MLESLNEETFARLLNTKFVLHAEPGQDSELELVEVSSGPVEKEGQGDCFSLIFRGPTETLFQQRIYNFEHPQIGSFDLFIVPIRRHTDGFYYEVIFNRQTH